MVELTPFQERLYVILEDCAQAGKVCPSTSELADAIGCTGGAIAGIFARLEFAEMIRVHRIDRSQRIVTITSTGKATADPRPSPKVQAAPKEKSFRQIAFEEASHREKQFRDAATFSRTRVIEHPTRSTPADGRRASGVCWYCGSRTDACQCREGAR